MPAPKQILDLIQRFDQNRDAYRSGQYNETQLRREFIDPFFMALGWDVENKQGFGEAYKQVIHEDAIKVGGATKAPDYCFRIGGTRKFFLEAKKPSVSIKEETSPAFQLRRYAWSAKLPLSILTDFEEFAVYDCRIRPAKTDGPATARIQYLDYSHYPERWDEIASIFSPDAIQKGSFDRYVEATKVKKGTAEVDDAFLEDIESWREMLARNLAIRNPNLSPRELNFAVQRTIDRIIFLRICEDRGIESYGRLMALLNGDRVYARLFEIFHRADERYNSGLFHFEREKDRHEQPDDLTPRLALDDKSLKDILRRLYYPESPYEFSVITADILGQVYERFLGKVIRLTEGHHAVVEEKPEVRKAGGVYYTPTYIVDYIVKNTVGRLLGAHVAQPPPAVPTKITPKQVSKLRILDPACGSGSFLIGAYQHLLDWHRDWYTHNEPDKWATSRSPALCKGPHGDWQLTTSERKRILLNNIYGVDIDTQAVEVTKLSLLLKVLEGQNQQTLENQLRLFHERALPDLGDNIKCGNSLIGTDFYDLPLVKNHVAQPPLAVPPKPQTPTPIPLQTDDRQRINPFDWPREFPEIMQSGGFDAVIGNPPYLRIQGLQEHYGDQVAYFTSHYQSAVKRFDLYLLFAERGFTLLAKGGRLGYICPHKFLNSDFGSGFRKFLKTNNALDSFISFGSNLVFEDSSTYTGILSLRKGEANSFRYCEFEHLGRRDVGSALARLNEESFASYDLDDFSTGPWTFVNRNSQRILDSICRQPSRLGQVFDEILVGVQSGIDNVHVLRATGTHRGTVVQVFSEKENGNVEIESELLKPFLRGEDVHRYKQVNDIYYVIYPYKLINGNTTIIEEAELRERFPLGYTYLVKYRNELRQIRLRQKTNIKYWYSCHRCRDMKVFERRRIVTPYASLGCNMTMAPAGVYHNTKVYSLVPPVSRKEKLEYWLGLLNSKLLWWFISNTGYVLRGGYFAFTTDYLNPFPIPVLNLSNATDNARHDRMVALVEQILSLHNQLAAAKLPNEKDALQRQIEATDRQIDRLVYELYGLTEEEIKIVEEMEQ